MRIPDPSHVVTPPSGDQGGSEGQDEGGSEGQGQGGSEGQGQGGSDGQGEGQGGTQDQGTLCTDIGQTPMIIAYYTENSSVLPDPTLVTHINYAHGRFADPTNGDGGIVIAKPDLMKQVIALKAQNPRLKV
ncbi:MAG: hypothetical protein MJY62_02475, partial [Bacteroidales bacterium]|nr:hypothetical protein [Bacteroidales bacterium]